MCVILLLRNRARLPRDITASGPDHQILAARADLERMPARLAARFESEDVLMTKLGNDLPRGVAARGGSARHEGVAAGPVGQIGEWTTERGSLKCRRGDLSRRVV